MVRILFWSEKSDQLVAAPVTQLEFTRESSTLDKVNRFKSTGKLGTAGLCSNVLLLDYILGNRLAFMAATQEEMQYYSKTHLIE